MLNSRDIRGYTINITPDPNTLRSGQLLKVEVRCKCADNLLLHSWFYKNKVVVRVGGDGEGHMMRHNDQRRRRRRSAGAAFILVLLVLPALLAVSAMVINVAYMELTRTEAQIAVDAATRAAGYEYARTRSTDQAYIAARDMAARNRVAGGSLPLASSDLTYGVAYRPTGDSRYLFQQGGTNPNSVRIETRSLQQNAAKVFKAVIPSAGSVWIQATA